MVRLPGWGPPPLPLPQTVTYWRTPPSLNPVVIRPPQSAAYCIRMNIQVLRDLRSLA